MKKIGIYQIQSKLKPDRKYVGSAEDIGQRWRNHLSQLKKNKHHSKKLQGHYNKYGKQDLIFSILVECDKEDLLIFEQKFIDDYKPSFNICQVAGNVRGHFVSDEARKKISNANKGSIVPEERRKRISMNLKGYKRPAHQLLYLKGNKNYCKITPEIHDYIINNKGVLTQKQMGKIFNIHQSTISKHLKAC